MHKKFNYGTITEAIRKLRASGFNKDFNLKDGFVWCGNRKIEADDLKIVSVSRYEGNSDPGDAATVYGLETKTGLKGIVVKGDSTSLDASTISLLKKLHLAKLNNYSNKFGARKGDSATAAYKIGTLEEIMY